MTFEEWLKDKYKDKLDAFEINVITEYLEYHQCEYDELYDKIWDDIMIG